MRFRGPQALGNRPRKAMVCPTGFRRMNGTLADADETEAFRNPEDFQALVMLLFRHEAPWNLINTG